MHYRYIAYHPIQGLARGEVYADSEDEAALAIKGQGYRIIQLRFLRRLPRPQDIFPSLFHVSAGEVVDFARQLAILIGTGTNLIRSLELLQRQTKKRVMAETLASILKALDKGESFSEAISQYPKIFGQFFCRVVEVGEYTGRLDSSLRHIANLLDYQVKTRKKAMKALMYPMAVLGMSLITTAILFTVALPPLLGVFERLGSSVPLPTRLALGLSRLIQDNISYLFIGLPTSAVLGKLLLGIHRVRYLWHSLLLHIPILGSLLLDGELARFSRSGSVLLEAGVPILVLMDLAVQGSGNLVIHRAFSEARDGVLKGKSLAEGLAQHSMIPATFVQMIATGEETNSLSQAMGYTANAYEQQAEQKVDAVIGLLEPMATLGVALVIGFIAFSMFLPIYSGLGSLK